MQGRRLYPDEHGNIKFESIEPGDYYKSPHTGWGARLPDGRFCGLNGHKIEEHDDGSITVSPSILVKGGGVDGEWHGFLDRGVWRT